MPSKIAFSPVLSIIAASTLTLFVVFGFLFVELRRRATRPSSIEAAAFDSDPLLDAMKTVAFEKFPKKPVFGDIFVDFSTREVSFLGKNWKRQSEPATDTGFLRFGMKVWEFLSDEFPEWRLLYAEVSNPSIERQFQHSWWFQKNVDGKWSDLGLKKTYFQDGDVWEFFYRTPISYVQNCWEGDGSKGNEYDIENKVSPPKHTPNRSPDFIEKLAKAISESKIPYEQATHAWYYPLTHVNAFERFGSFSPPIDVTASLADSPIDWSICIVERQFSSNAPDDKFSVEDKLHTLLWGHNWFPLREALEEIGWPKNPFASGKSDVLEWRFTDESDNTRHRLVFRFRLVRNERP